ncbi:MAG: hypothetical protein ACRD0A_19025 [Acidimicrobiales bacterium]
MGTARSRRKSHVSLKDRERRHAERAARRKAKLAARPLRRLRRGTGWLLVAVGVVLVAAGYLRVTVLPFEPHHTISQLGGLVTAIVGLVWALDR